MILWYNMGRKKKKNGILQLWILLWKMKNKIFSVNYPFILLITSNGCKNKTWVMQTEIYSNFKLCSLVLYLHNPSDNGFTLLNACTERSATSLKIVHLYTTTKAAFFLQSSIEPLKLKSRVKAALKILSKSHFVRKLVNHSKTSSNFVQKFWFENQDRICMSESKMCMSEFVQVQWKKKKPLDLNITWQDKILSKSFLLPC